MGCKARGLNPSGGKIFLTYPDRPWGPPNLLYNGYRVFPIGKCGRGVMLTSVVGLTYDTHQWLLLQSLVLLMIGAEGVRNM